jgi:Ca2+-binding EF-hand superfamily protein
MRLAAVLLIVTVAFVSSASSQTPPQAKPDPKKLPPQIAELFKLNADEFIARLDKNKDGTLTRDEVPPFLANNFAKIDSNGDGKLDRQEVARMLDVVRKRFGVDAAPAMPAANPQIEKIVAAFLQRLDTDKDGKISQKEAEGKPLGKAFARFDKNKDGFLDRAELRVLAAQTLAKGPKKGPPAAAGFPRNQPDFDALDANADGRLTREELAGSPLLRQFEEIDTNRDGRIDRREFEAYLKKQAEQKKTD